jgi:fatty acid desaturase
VSLIQGTTARGIVPAIVGFRLAAAGLLVALALIGGGFRPVIFATLMLAVLIVIVAYEVSHNLRSDAHHPHKPSAG